MLGDSTVAYVQPLSWPTSDFSHSNGQQCCATSNPSLGTTYGPPAHTFSFPFCPSRASMQGHPAWKFEERMPPSMRSRSPWISNFPSFSMWTGPEAFCMYAPQEALEKPSTAVTSITLPTPGFSSFPVLLLVPLSCFPGSPPQKKASPHGCRSSGPAQSQENANWAEFWFTHYCSVYSIFIGPIYFQIYFSLFPLGWSVTRNQAFKRHLIAEKLPSQEGIPNFTQSGSRAVSTVLCTHVQTNWKGG